MLHVDKIIDLFGNQKQMAIALNVDASAIAHWKKRKQIPTKQLVNIRNQLKVKNIELDLNAMFVD